MGAGERWVGRREGVGRAAGLGAEGEEREVADEARGVGVGVKEGVVGLTREVLVSWVGLAGGVVWGNLVV